MAPEAIVERRSWIGEATEDRSVVPCRSPTTMTVAKVASILELNQQTIRRWIDPDPV